MSTYLTKNPLLRSKNSIFIKVFKDVNSAHSIYLCELDGDFHDDARDAHDDLRGLRGLRDVPPQRETNPMPSVIFQSVVHKNSRLIIG